MGNFGFFQLIQNYAETTLSIDEKHISQEAAYTAQQTSRRDKYPKTCLREYFCLIVKKCDFYFIKPKICAQKTNLNNLLKFLEI